MPRLLNTVVAMILLAGASIASAATLTFGSAFGSPTSYTESGYNASLIGGGPFYLATNTSCDPSCADNGTYFAGLGYINQNVFSIKANDGHAFTFNAFDGAEFPFNNIYTESWAAGITVTGVRLDNSTVSLTYTLDQINDGTGGVADFQHFVFNSNELFKEVRFSGVANSLGRASYAIDNVVLNEATLPEPGIFALLGMGLLGFAGARRKAAR